MIILKQTNGLVLGALCSELKSNYKETLQWRV